MSRKIRNSKLKALKKCQIVACKVNVSDSTIKSIQVNNMRIELKISQYAKDTTVFVHGDLDSITTLLRVLNDFKEHPGPEINTVQTDSLWLGEWKAERMNLLVLKGQCHEDFAVLGQFCAKITTLRL